DESEEGKHEQHQPSQGSREYKHPKPPFSAHAWHVEEFSILAVCNRAVPASIIGEVLRSGYLFTHDDPPSEAFIARYATWRTSMKQFGDEVILRDNARATVLRSVAQAPEPLYLVSVRDGSE